MKKASETNEVEILDEAFLHHGGQSAWGMFGSQRMSPAEIVADAEEGEKDEAGRGRLLMVFLDLVLAHWGAEQDAERVGARVLSVAAAVNHLAGRGLPMLGARLRLDAAGSREDFNRILDWLLKPGTEVSAVGKRVVGLGKFLGHSAFDGWSMSALGRACGETPQAMQERIEVLCETPLRFTGSKGKAVWQQGEDQRENSSKAQKDFYQNKKTKRKTTKKHARKRSRKSVDPAGTDQGKQDESAESV